MPWRLKTTRVKGVGERYWQLTVVKNSVHSERETLIGRSNISNNHCQHLDISTWSYRRVNVGREKTWTIQTRDGVCRQLVHDDVHNRRPSLIADVFGTVLLGRLRASSPTWCASFVRVQGLVDWACHRFFSSSSDGSPGDGDGGVSSAFSFSPCATSRRSRRTRLDHVQ
ncbi:hypothetical protein OG21DRAFT_897259 [Imleria badia]|nr:hypothetical protein OG21DRAFT_897259 [Imleria badia]